MRLNLSSCPLVITAILGSSAVGALGQAGEVDPTFRAANVNGAVYAITRQTDGRILIGGAFTEVDGFVRRGVARLDPDGSVDQDFDPGISVGGILNIAIQTDGKILAGGIFGSYNGLNAGLARLHPDGSRDTNFNNGSGAYAYALAYHPTERIYIAQGRYIRRLHLDGTVDETFSMTLPEEGFHGLPSRVGDFHVEPDGRILMSGNFWQVNGQDRHGLARLNPDGTLAPTFFAGAPQAEVVGLAPDGKIYLAGLTLQRFHADGTFDDTFGYDLYGEFFDCIDVQQDGKPLVGGNFHLERELLARFNLDGTIDQSFSGFVDGQVSAILVQPDGRILIGGGFSHVNGELHVGIARLIGDAPVLDRQRVGSDKLVLSWPSAYTNCVLQSASNLMQEDWNTVEAAAVTSSGGMNYVTNDIADSGNRFFRLMMP